MDSKKIQLYREALLADLKRLIAKLKGRDLALAQVEMSEGMDEGDLSVMIHEGYVLTKVAEGDFEKLKSIESAIERLNNGTYGGCLKCEEPIAEKRLQAHPHAALCILCQEAAESEKTIAPVSRGFGTTFEEG